MNCQLIAEDIELGADSLPQSVRNKLSDNGFKIVAASAVVEELPYLKEVHPRGYGESDTFENVLALMDHFNRLVLVAEKSKSGDNTDAPNGVRYESGHAIDALYSFSDSAEYMKAYENDVKRMGLEDRQYLAYLLQGGNAGPCESFAEVFATIHGGSRNAYFKQRMEQCFPETIKVVRQMLT